MPRNPNVGGREDVVVPRLDEWIGRLFDPDNRKAALAMMATVRSATPVPPETRRADALLAECDRELGQ